MSKVRELLKITSKIRQNVREKNGVTEEDVQQNIKAIREWLEKTPHLPDEKSDGRLENFLLRNRMSVEKTKNALESYFTAKNVLSEYFNNILPYSMAYQKAKSYTFTIVMPELLYEYSRITIHKLSNTDSDLYDPLEAFTIMTMTNEIRFSKDYSNSDTVIIDLDGYSLKHLIKFTPRIIRKLRILFTKSFNFKVNCIHLINVPQYTDKILSIFRSIIPGKIYKKVVTHTSLEHLYKYVPKTYLPSDYGGEQPTIIDLFKKWCQETEHWTNFFTQQLDLRSDESKRVGRNHEFEIFGTGSDGSFKKLNVQL